MMRGWLRRLWLSFFMIGAVLFWTAYKAVQNQTAVQPANALEFIGAIACFSLGLAAVRERHRNDEWRD
jgi:hypothetical protein